MDAYYHPGVLPDYQLIQFGERLVQPFDAAMVQPASIDVRLGREFITWPAAGGQLDLAEPVSHDGLHHTVEYGDSFAVAAGEGVLGVTAERVTVPDDMLARIEGKSSLARYFLAVHITAGFIDPGFRGLITFEIVNLSKRTIVLYPGMPVAQLAFERLAAPAQKPYAGRYQDSQGVEASKYDEK